MESKPVYLYVVGVAAVLAAVGGVGFIGSARQAEADREASARTAEVQAGPRVVVVPVTRAPASRRVELQGEARPFASVTLYAKVSGYLKEIRVDKGDRVKANQVLAVIESPELDRQYDSAVADANYKRVDAKRAASLAAPGVVSARDAELQDSLAKMAEANVAALETQKSYETLRAPFAGVVTSRFADPGALVQNAANAQTGALPVVTVSQVERLRVYVYVDQRDAAAIHAGDAAEITVPERLDVQVKGKVTRTTRELDPKTRMMLVEVDLDNRDGQIVPGSFVSVGLVIASARHIEVPVEALVVRAKTPYLAVVKDGRVNYRAVTLAGDDGAKVQVARGVDEGELVAINLGSNVADGDRVQVVGAPGESKRNAERKN
jgi:RND family efflux transporter MFP subunit